MLIAAIAPFLGGKRSNSPWFVSLPLTVGADVAELSGSGPGSQGNDAARRVQAVCSHQGWPELAGEQQSCWDSHLMPGWRGAARLSLVQLGPWGMGGLGAVWGLERGRLQTDTGWWSSVSSAVDGEAMSCLDLAGERHGEEERHDAVACPSQPQPSYSPVVDYSYIFIIHTTP